MAHPRLRTAAQRGSDSEHITAIAGGGPNQPRVMLDAIGAWVTSPYGGGSGWASGLVPACLRVQRVSILPLTANESMSESVRRLLEARMRSRRGDHLAGRIIAETGSDPASVRLVQTCGGTAAVAVVGRAYSIVHGGRDPIHHATDAAGAQMLGAQWLVSATDGLLPREPSGVERGWPYVHGKIVVDLSQIEADADGSLTADDVRQALASTERLIRNDGAADAALALQSPVEAVSAALMLALSDMQRFGPTSDWNVPLPRGVWRA